MLPYETISGKMEEGITRSERGVSNRSSFHFQIAYDPKHIYTPMMRLVSSQVVCSDVELSSHLSSV